VTRAAPDARLELSERVSLTELSAATMASQYAPPLHADCERCIDDIVARGDVAQLPAFATHVLAYLLTDLPPGAPDAAALRHILDRTARVVQAICASAMEHEPSPRHGGGADAPLQLERAACLALGALASVGPVRGVWAGAFFARVLGRSSLPRSVSSLAVPFAAALCALATGPRSVATGALAFGLEFAFAACQGRYMRHVRAACALAWAALFTPVAPGRAVVWLGTALCVEGGLLSQASPADRLAPEGTERRAG